MCSTHAAFTVRTVILTMSWYAAKWNSAQDTPLQTEVPSLYQRCLCHSSRTDWKIPQFPWTSSAQMEEVLKTKWSHIRDSIYCAAITTFITQRKSNADWCEIHLSDMEPVIEAKHSALLNYKKNSNISTLSALITARSTAQRTARKCANDYWQNLCGKGCLRA